MYFKFEYPWPTLCVKEEGFFEDITMFDLSFHTMIHYFKNHSTGYKQFVFKVLGFGIRIESKHG